jgi:hypothetical protein
VKRTAWSLAKATALITRPDAHPNDWIPLNALEATTTRMILALTIPGPLDGAYAVAAVEAHGAVVNGDIDRAGP